MMAMVMTSHGVDLASSSFFNEDVTDVVDLILIT